LILVDNNLVGFLGSVTIIIDNFIRDD